MPLLTIKRSFLDTGGMGIYIKAMRVNFSVNNPL